MLYRWYQDNASVTVDIFVPPDTLPTQLRLLLAKRRVTLKSADGLVLLRRKTYAPIDPRCTDCYTMSSVVTDAEGRTALRAVLYKAVQAGWISLFLGDGPSQGLVPSPAPLSHAMMHVAALARAREASAREAAAIATLARAVSRDGREPPMQTWRHGCHIVRKKTPGGTRIHYERDPPETALPTSGAPATMPAAPRGWRMRQEFSTMRRHTAHRAPLSHEEMAADAAREAQRELKEAQQHEEAEHERVASRRDAEAARAAVDAVRKGQAPPTGRAEGGSDASSDDDEEHERWEGGGAHPDDIEYPLPGSDASCDACGQIVNKYYHCVQCGAHDGFDLCETCHRMGIYPDKHIRRYPSHSLRYVSAHTAPLVAKEPKMQKAPPAPPPPPPPGFNATSARTVSERVIVPLEAKVQYEWSQFSSEINLTVALPAGTRARELVVVVQPFLISVSLKGFGAILRGSLHKGVRHKETVWTIEEGALRILLVKGDQQSWKKLFPHENEMSPMEAIRQVCEDPEPVDHSYMDLAPEARGLVDLHRNYKHLMATGDMDGAQELEEEMKMMRFNWGKNKGHMEA